MFASKCEKVRLCKFALASMFDTKIEISSFFLLYLVYLGKRHEKIEDIMICQHYLWWNGSLKFRLESFIYKEIGWIEAFLHYLTKISADYFLKRSMLQNGHNLAKIKKTQSHCCTQTAKLLSKSKLPAPFENSVHHYIILSQHQNLPWLIIFWCLGHKHNRESVCFVL